MENLSLNKSHEEGCVRKPTFVNGIDVSEYGITRDEIITNLHARKEEYDQTLKELKELKEQIAKTNEDKTYWFRESQEFKSELDKSKRMCEQLETTVRTLVKIFSTESCI